MIPVCNQCGAKRGEHWPSCPTLAPTDAQQINVMANAVNGQRWPDYWAASDAAQKVICGDFDHAIGANFEAFQEVQSALTAERAARTQAEQEMDAAKTDTNPSQQNINASRLSQPRTRKAMNEKTPIYEDILAEFDESPKLFADRVRLRKRFAALELAANALAKALRKMVKLHCETAEASLAGLEATNESDAALAQWAKLKGEK